MRSLSSTLSLCGILLLALVVRAIDINGQSFFSDEVSEILFAKTPVAAIIHAHDSMPPLYPLVHKAWLATWQTDAASRWLSAVCGVASVVCVWGIGRRLVDEPTGLAAAFITALLPLHVYYSQFVRCYALLFLLVALDLWLLLRAVDTDRWSDWLAFAAVAVLGCYTHYYFAIFLATSVVVAWLRRRQIWIGNRAVAAYIGIALAAAPLLWLLPGDLGFQKSLRAPRTLNAETFGYTYFSFFSGYTLGPSQPELQTMSGPEAIWAAAPWIAAVGVVLLLLGYEGWRVLRARGVLPIVLVLLLLPVLLVGGLSIAGGLNYNVRFVLWSMIGAAVWLGAGLAAGWNKWPVRIALVGFLLLSVTAIYHRHAVPRYQNEDLRGAAEYLRANATPADNIYIVSDYLADVLRYYLGDGWNVVELPVPSEVNRVVRNEVDAFEGWLTVNVQQPRRRRFWLIYSRPFHGDPDGLLLNALRTKGLRPKLAATMAGVQIYRYGR